MRLARTLERLPASLRSDVVSQASARFRSREPPDVRLIAGVVEQASTLSARPPCSQVVFFSLALLSLA